LWVIQYLQWGGGLHGDGECGNEPGEEDYGYKERI